MATPSPGAVTQLIERARSGHGPAVAELVPLVYDELRRMAARHLRRERKGHSLQATALVHDVYLRLLQDEPLSIENRAHFFGIASRSMRRILVEHARGRDAAKRGGDRRRVTLGEGVAALEPRGIELVALNAALERLALHDPQQALVVELRYFGGLTNEEAAEAAGVSPATVKRDWTMARAWLFRELTGGEPA